MNIFVVGINYKVAPVEIRETIKFNEEEYGQALIELKKLPRVEECAMISTCNRTEVYFHAETNAFDSDCVESLLCRLKGLEIHKMKKYFYFYKGTNAIKHIFNVACGIDSMTRFEDQILGQLRNSHDIAMNAGMTSAVLNTLFRKAITAAKKIKTHMGSYPQLFSVADIAVGILKKTLKDTFKDRSVMVIGTGTIGNAVIEKLIHTGIGNIYVTRRTHSKTAGFSENRNIKVIDYSQRYAFMDACDVIISSTSSPHYTVTKDMLENSIKDSTTVRTFIDLAVPRDIDSTIKQLPYVRYYNIDDMKTDGEHAQIEENDVICFVQEIIGQYVLEFKRWYEFKQIMPVVMDIQRFADGIIKEKCDYALTKLDLDESMQKVVRTSISSAVNGILDKLVYSTRELDDQKEREIYLRLLGDILVYNQ